jgi:hypothetical protein
VDSLLAFASALLALRLAGRIGTRWRARRAPELLAWGGSLLAYAIATAALAWGAAAGWDERSFRVYYLFGGLLTAPLLGAGSLLLWRRRWAAPVALLYVGFAVGLIAFADVHGEFGSEGIPAAQDHLDLGARLPAIVANSLGTAAVVVVALSTFRSRPRGNALILLGTALAAVGTALAGLGEAETAAFAAAAVVCLYLGFVTPRSGQRASAQSSAPKAIS